MEWHTLLLITLAAIGMATTSFFDNFVTDTYFRGRKPEAQKIFTIFTCAIMLVGMLILFPPASAPILYIALAAGAGAINSLGSIFYYRALSHEETTGVTILLQFTPVIALVSGIFILGESIGPFQFVAIGLLLLAAVLIIHSHGRRRLHVQLRTTLLLLIAMLFFVGSDTLFVLAGGEFDFPTGFFYFLLGRLAIDIFLAVMMKSWRTRIRNVFREFRFRLIRTAIANELIDMASGIIWRIAILSAPIALATAVENTAQLIATFLLGLVFTIIWPHFGREKLKKRTVGYHLLALILSVSAILLIQLTSS